MGLINYTYERNLAYFYHQIDQRGLYVDETKLALLRNEVEQQIIDKCKLISDIWNCHVFVGRANDNGTAGAVNLNSTKGEKALLKKLKDLGYDLPKVRTKNKQKEIEYKESTCDLVLQKVFAENQFGLTLGPGELGDPAIKAILDVRELKTLKDRYINARLFNHKFFSNYNVAGTTSGRRSSRKNLFNLGGNAQNFPKHTKTAKAFRDCIISRPGHIFFSVDQISAEDWPVSALAENHNSLAELRSGVDRHRKLACAVFQLPWNHYDDKTWKDSIERYLGKKIRHANNYGMRGNRMSDALAQEGKCFPKDVCQALLDKANEIDPSIKGVFHNYVKNAIFNTRTLCTPLGRERQFFGLRPNSDNYEILNEAYSYIPQSTVGDNTGLAITTLFGLGGATYVVQEGHDSILQDVPDDDKILAECFKNVVTGFSRTIRFHNGIDIQIPIEAEVGYTLESMVKVKDFSEDGLIETVRKLRPEKEALIANASTYTG